jgi:hypothetical protein
MWKRGGMGSFSDSRRRIECTSAELFAERWSGGGLCWCWGKLAKRSETWEVPRGWSASSSPSAQAQWNISLDVLVLAMRPEEKSGRGMRERGEREAARSRRRVSRRRRSDRDDGRGWSCMGGFKAGRGGASTWGDIVSKVGSAGEGTRKGEGSTEEVRRGVEKEEVI